MFIAFKYLETVSFYNIAIIVFLGSLYLISILFVNRIVPELISSLVNLIKFS